MFFLNYSYSSLIIFVLHHVFPKYFIQFMLSFWAQMLHIAVDIQFLLLALHLMLQYHPLQQVILFYSIICVCILSRSQLGCHKELNILIQMQLLNINNQIVMKSYSYVRKEILISLIVSKIKSQEFQKFDLMKDSTFSSYDIILFLSPIQSFQLLITRELCKLQMEISKV